MKRLSFSKTDLLPIFVLASLGLSILSLGWQAANTLAINRESRKPAPTLVQLVDGRAIQVSPMGEQERTPEAVKHFVSQTLYLLFNWSGTLPPANPQEERIPKPDPGVKVTSRQQGGVGTLITTSSWQASFALSETYRNEFLEILAGLTPREVFARSLEAVLIIRHISEPEQIEPGKWKVNVVADRILFDRSNNQGKPIAFNREIFVQAVPQPISPLKDKASPLEQTVYETRQAGLEIHAMRELKQGDL